MDTAVRMGPRNIVANIGLIVYCRCWSHKIHINVPEGFTTCRWALLNASVRNLLWEYHLSCVILRGKRKNMKWLSLCKSHRRLRALAPAGVRVDTSALAVHHAHAAATACWTPLKIHSTHKHATHKFIWGGGGSWEHYNSPTPCQPPSLPNAIIENW